MSRRKYGLLLAVAVLGVISALVYHRRSDSARSSGSSSPERGARATTTLPPARVAAPETSRRSVDRQQADAIRRRVAARRAAEEQALAASAKAVAAPIVAGAGPSTSLPIGEQQRRREYLTRAVREQYIPVAKSCYEELLARHPRAAGKVVVSFAIVGDGDAGVVDRVELADGTTIDDPEFTLCVRESLYTTVFEPPPPGARETTVLYPLDFAP